MALLHDTSTRASIENRIRALTPNSRPTWGKMSVDQMLWHVNQALDISLGRVSVGPERPKLPPWLLRLMVVNLPWPKGAPTHPDLVPKQQFNFDAERERLLEIINEITAKPMDDAWPRHPGFGHMSGRQVSTLTHKHLNHHLTQFGV